MEYTISRFFKTIIALVPIVTAGWLLYQLSSIVTVVIISMLLAYILDPLTSAFESRGISRTFSTVVIFLLIGLIIVGLFAYFIPLLIDEINQIQRSIEGGQSSEYFKQLETFIQEKIPLISADDLDIDGRITRALAALTDSFFLVLGSVVSLVTTLVVIPFAVFFLLKDGPAITKTLIGMIPNRYFEMTLNILHKIDLQLGAYLRGQSIDAFIVGVLSIIALWLLDVKYFIMIGIFAGLANLIPYVGPLVGGGTAVLVVLMNGGGSMDVLMVIGAFLIIQLIDNVIIQPLVVAKSVDMHPLIVIFAVIVGGQFFGILGMLLAVPVTGIIKVSVSELYQGFRRYNII